MSIHTPGLGTVCCHGLVLRGSDLAVPKRGVQRLSVACGLVVGAYGLSNIFPGCSPTLLRHCNLHLFLHHVLLTPRFTQTRATGARDMGLL